MVTQQVRLWLEQQEQQPWKTAEEIENNRKQRLERYKEGKRKLVEQIEQAFLGGDMDKVYRMIEFPLRKKAEKISEHWVNYRLSANDFESAFWEEAMRVIDRYQWGSGTGEYLLYETLILAWDREAKDIQRHASKTRKGRVDYAAVPLSELFDDHYADPRVNVEDEAINHVLIEQIEREQCLSPKERDVLTVLKRYPDSRLRELQKLTGYDKTTVSRIIARMRSKLVQHGYDDVYDTRKDCPLEIRPAS